MLFCSLIYFAIRIGGFRARVPFLVVKDLTVDYLLETSFIVHHVNAVLFGLQENLFYRPSSVTFNGQRCFTQPETPLTLKLEDPSRKIRTTQKSPFRQCPKGNCKNYVRPGVSALFQVP